jgi:hypothetical protein
MISLKGLKEEGYYLQEEKYNNGVKFFSIEKDEGEDITSIIGEVSYQTALKVNKKWGLPLKYTKKITIPLNYKAFAPTENHLRYFVNEPLTITKVL